MSFVEVVKQKAKGEGGRQRTFTPRQKREEFQEIMPLYQYSMLP
jgi:hypothetical protein